MNIVVEKESLVLRLYSSLHHSLYACHFVNLSKVTWIAKTALKKEAVWVKWGQVVCEVGRHAT